MKTIHSKYIDSMFNPVLLRKLPVEHLLSFSVLALILAWAVARIFIVPYSGNLIDSVGVVDYIFVSAPENSLKIGDRVLKIDGLIYQAFRQMHSVQLYDGIKPGDTVIYTIQRGDAILEVTWTMPGINRRELFDRFFNVWWLGVIFWIFGTISMLTVRPKDTRWQLLVAFNYINSILFTTSRLANSHYWFSSYALMIAGGFCMPVYWHLHLHFPNVLMKTPRFTWPFIYGVTSLFVLGMVGGFFPSAFHNLTYFFGIAGSAFLLIWRYFRKPEQRRDVRSLVIGFFLASLPAVILSISRLNGASPQRIIPGLFGLALIPTTYLFVIFRRKYGNLEMRINQAITLYIFFLFLIVTNLLILSAVIALIPQDEPQTMLASAIISVSLLALISVPAYPHFEQWVNRRILHVPLPPEHLLENYSARISLSLTRERLVEILTLKVLPSLLIRQAALLRVFRLENSTTGPDLFQSTEAIFHMGIREEQLPTLSEIQEIMKSLGNIYLDNPTSWYRLALPLQVSGELIGILLLGRRDPDDYYSSGEIQVLQGLMDHTALALLNLEQASHLHAMFQDNIAHQEAYRRALASELHDDVLQHLANLVNIAADEKELSKNFLNTYQASVEHIRGIISGLRPKMLDYGLYTALEQLAEETANQVGAPINISLQVTESDIRYSEDVEAHMFRIVQQACQNAIKHAQAKRISIHGKLEENLIDIQVEDDGVGFEEGIQPDLSWLLAHKHFGLANMYERANLIRAQFNITSRIYQGTSIHIRWRK